MNNLEEIKRGEEADRILKNPLFIESFDNIRESIINSMSQSAFGDSETHNRLVIAMQLLSQIEKQFKDHIATGKMAALKTEDKFKFFRS
jgi:hypothetical protein